MDINSLSEAIAENINTTLQKMLKVIEVDVASGSIHSEREESVNHLPLEKWRFIFLLARYT